MIAYKIGNDRKWSRLLEILISESCLDFLSFDPLIERSYVTKIAFRAIETCKYSVILHNFIMTANILFELASSLILIQKILHLRESRIVCLASYFLESTITSSYIPLTYFCVIPNIIQVRQKRTIHLWHHKCNTMIINNQITQNNPNITVRIPLLLVEGANSRETCYPLREYPVNFEWPYV